MILKRFDLEDIRLDRFGAPCRMNMDNVQVGLNPQLGDEKVMVTIR